MELSVQEWFENSDLEVWFSEIWSLRCLWKSICTLVSLEEVLRGETDQLWGWLVPYWDSYCRVKIYVYTYSYT